MENSGAPRAIEGDLLSCYTTSIAEYLERNGIDHQLAMGTQLFLAVRCQSAPELALSFVHYHTPLLGERTTHALELVRCRAATPEEAAERIAAQCRAVGTVIVVGDAMQLPWLVTCGQRHAPHWFTVTGIDAPGGVAAIADRFEFVDEAGTQQPFVGTIELEQLGRLAQVNPQRSHVFEARDLWAFGAREQTGVSIFDGYQWFEASQPLEARPVDEAQLLGLLEQTWAFHSGARRREDLAGPEWACGLAALGWLAECARAHLSDPALYAYADDLWVSGRNRQLFARVLARLAGELGLAALGDTAAWCEEQIVPQWAALPRIMRYNQGCMQRGRAPTALLIEVLDKLAELEAGLMERLRAALD